jgi:hypothetical protein
MTRLFDIHPDLFAAGAGRDVTRRIATGAAKANQISLVARFLR